MVLSTTPLLSSVTSPQTLLETCSWHPLALSLPSHAEGTSRWTLAGGLSLAHVPDQQERLKELIHLPQLHFPLTPGYWEESGLPSEGVFCKNWPPPGILPDLPRGKGERQEATLGEG